MHPNKHFINSLTYWRLRSFRLEVAIATPMELEFWDWKLSPRSFYRTTLFASTAFLAISLGRTRSTNPFFPCSAWLLHCTPCSHSHPMSTDKTPITQAKSVFLYKPDPETWLHQRPKLQQTRSTTRTAPCCNQAVCWWDSEDIPVGNIGWLPW